MRNRRRVAAQAIHSEVVDLRRSTGCGHRKRHARNRRRNAGWVNRARRRSARAARERHRAVIAVNRRYGSTEDGVHVDVSSQRWI
jgi:hypothetical protein